MNILFVSRELIGGNLACILKEEGHSVKLYIEKKQHKNSLLGLVAHTDDWQKELTWVGKKGLIVFDDVGFGDVQMKLRDQGYTVFGGSSLGDKLEQDRYFATKVLKEQQINIVDLFDFENPEAAINFIKKNKKIWVIKQNNHHYSKSISYIGKRKDGKDVIDILEKYTHDPITAKEKITLQERVDGIEIGVGRYFNGKKWVGPIEYNIEHPHLFPGNIGPITSELGTLAWYDDDETNILYKKTIAKMENYLREIDFRGDFEINLIVNKKGIYPLEITARLGSPIIHLHTALHKSPWGEFLHAVASGNDYNLKWRKGFGIVTLLATPPFPYVDFSHPKAGFIGSSIFFNKLTNKEWHNVHLEEVSYDKKRKQFYISDNCGFIMYVTSVSKTIELAQKSTQQIIKKIQFPKMIYRPDIGSRFSESEQNKLIEWGYLKKLKQ